MTYQNVIDKANGNRDDFSNPYIPLAQTLQQLNDSIYEFVVQQYNRFEKTESVREDLRLYVKRFTVLSNILPLTSIADFMYNLGIRATFGAGLNPVQAEARAVTWDKLQTLLTDPFAQPSDRSPVYYQYYNGTDPVIFVVGESIPTGVTITYLKTPVVATVSNLGSDIDLPDNAAVQVARILTRKMQAVTEAYNDYQLSEQEEEQQVIQ